jgi:aryl carrier-like protein
MEDNRRNENLKIKVENLAKKPALTAWSGG